MNWQQVPTEETQLGEIRPNPKSTVGTEPKVNRVSFTTLQQSRLTPTPTPSQGGLMLSSSNCVRLIKVALTAPSSCTYAHAHDDVH
jgi:hypothetical protein